MSKETKFRPTFTHSELRAIVLATTESLRARVNIGDFDSPQVKQLASVKKYTERFLINIADPLDLKTGSGVKALKQPTVADKLRELGLDEDAARLESGSSATQTVETLDQPPITTSQLTNAIYSPLDNPKLTNDEIYDALCLKDESMFTAEERKFFLDVGTFIRVARATTSKKQVNENDL